MKGVALLIGNMSFDDLLADFETRGEVAMISPKADRNVRHNCGKEACKWRHLVVTYLAKIK